MLGRGIERAVAPTVLALILLTLAIDTTCKAAPATQSCAIKGRKHFRQQQVSMYHAGVTLNCPVSSRCKVDWFKDGRPLEFDAQTGATAFSPLIGRSAKNNAKLTISVMTPDMAGNYTCLLVDNTRYPNGCPTGQPHRPDCYAPEAMATLWLTVGAAQVSMLQLLSYFPPLPTNTTWPARSPAPQAPQSQPRVYLSRESDARTAIGNLGGPADSEFICRLVVLPVSSSTPPPQVKWFKLGRDEFGKQTANTSNNYTTAKPLQPQVCNEADLGVYFLTPAQRGSMRCYESSMHVVNVNEFTVGDYSCNAELQVVGGNSSHVSMLYTLTVPNKPVPPPPLPPPNPASRTAAQSPVSTGEGTVELMVPHVHFNMNTTVCLGATVKLRCRFKPSNSRARIQHRDAWLANYTLELSAGLNIGKYRGVQLGKNEFGELYYTMSNATVAHSGKYTCSVTAASGYGYVRQPTVENMWLTVRSDCHAKAVVIPVPNLVFVLCVAGAGLLIAVIFCVLVGIYFCQKRRNEPIKKRIVCVDNTEIYLRNRRHAESDAPLLGRSSYYRQESTERPVVPEVYVEVIGRRGRLLSRRVWERSQAPATSENSEANKEVRYLIPTHPRLEIDRKRIQMFRLLGEGAFGAVYSGQVTMSNTSTIDVAVKMLKRDYTEEEMIAIVKEMEIMKIMKKRPHPNLVKLIGVCTKGGGPFMLLVELAHHGNLRDFLKERHVSSTMKAQYLNVLPGTRRVCFMPCVKPVQLLRFSIDVANALEYMADIKIVHRDIAARNILVANADGEDAIVAKVADFGLTRNLSDKDYYRVINEGKLPVKWLAPECLKSRLFSTQSDVWAYGVLLYEIFSLGEIPYPGVSPSNIMPHLEAGNLNPQPRFAGPELYSLMRDCWAYEARYRPSFASLQARLENLQKCYEVTDAP